MASILEIIERNGKAQAQLIADVLDISRMISGRVTLHVTELSLARSVLDAVESLRPAAAAKRIALQVHIDAEPVVRTDPDRLQNTQTLRVLQQPVFWDPRCPERTSSESASCGAFSLDRFQLHLSIGQAF